MQKRGGGWNGVPKKKKVIRQVIRQVTPTSADKLIAYSIMLSSDNVQHELQRPSLTSIRTSDRSRSRPSTVHPIAAVMFCCTGSVHVEYRSIPGIVWQIMQIRTVPTRQHELDHTDLPERSRSSSGDRSSVRHVNTSTEQRMYDTSHTYQSS